ncbi:MAG: endonuclease III, partial [Clostridia bacterium]|nr:endonuclease III [Clostridia bacterium]
ADVEEVAEYIRKIGMYKTKSKNIVNMAKMLVEKFNGQVPEDYDALVSLPGVGRKTANVVLSVGFGHQRIAVDTHVFRVANKIGFVHEKDVLKTELALMEVIPKDRWTKTHHSLIFHGRNCCVARKPKCGQCPIKTYCEGCEE